MSTVSSMPGLPWAGEHSHQRLSVLMGPKRVNVVDVYDLAEGGGVEPPTFQSPWCSGPVASLPSSALRLAEDDELPDDRMIGSFK